MKLRLENKDCMIVMAEYPDNYFDLALVDPPYGINIAKNTHLGKAKYKNHTKKEWDNAIPTKEYFDELFRISKIQIIWGGNYFTNFLPISRSWIFWDKQQPQTPDFTFSAGELAWTNIDMQLKKLVVAKNKQQNCVSNNLSKALLNQKIHITQKPIELYDFCLRYSKVTKDFKIIDTHLGSGSSLISADKFNVADFVGCEIDKEYFDNLINRYNQFKAQTVLRF